MDYTVEVLRKCKEYGFKVYIDPHQDVVCISGARIHPHYLTARCQISGLDSQGGLVPPTGLCRHAVSTPRPSLLLNPLSSTRNILLEKTLTPLPFRP